MGTRKGTEHLPRGALLSSINEAVRELKSDDSQASFEAARRLADLGSKAATRSVIEIARRGPNEHSRRFAIYVLRSLEDKRSEGVMARILSSQSEPDGVRDEAAEALSVFVENGSPVALRALLSAQRDPSPAVRLSVAYSLGCSNSLHARNALMEMVNDRTVPEGALQSVGEMAREALSFTTTSNAEGIRSSDQLHHFHKSGKRASPEREKGPDVT
jgi:HEAT repeat protein